jgi:hypothetical protein
VGNTFVENVNSFISAPTFSSLPHLNHPHPTEPFITKSYIPQPIRTWHNLTQHNTHPFGSAPQRTCRRCLGPRLTNGSLPHPSRHPTLALSPHGGSSTTGLPQGHHRISNGPALVHTPRPTHRATLQYPSGFPPATIETQTNLN